MSDLHTRLLAELDGYIAAVENGEQLGLGYHALRAVVERHKPQPDAYCGATCSGCFNGLGERPTYPCPDIQAIADQLGLTEGTDRG